jgi:hypothetical protein
MRSLHSAHQYLVQWIWHIARLPLNVRVVMWTLDFEVWRKIKSRQHSLDLYIPAADHAAWLYYVLSMNPGKWKWCNVFLQGECCYRNSSWNCLDILVCPFTVSLFFAIHIRSWRWFLTVRLGLHLAFRLSTLLIMRMRVTLQWKYYWYKYWMIIWGTEFWMLQSLSWSRLWMTCSRIRIAEIGFGGSHFRCISRRFLIIRWKKGMWVLVSVECLTNWF